MAILGDMKGYPALRYRACTVGGTPEIGKTKKANELIQEEEEDEQEVEEEQEERGEKSTAEREEESETTCCLLRSNDKTLWFFMSSSPRTTVSIRGYPQSEMVSSMLKVFNYRQLTTLKIQE